MTGLRIKNLSLQVADKVLLRNLSVDLPSTGIVGLMGPMGVGKSSFAAWLCGVADQSLFHATYDDISIDDAPLSDSNRPALLPQKAAVAADQAIERLDQLIAQHPPLLCVDEVTALLPPEDAAKVLEWLKDAARQMPILMISHNQLQVACHAQQVMLLAGGRVQEVTPAKQFFTAPVSAAGQQFIRTGGAVVTNPETDPRHLMSDLREIPADLELTQEGPDANPTLQWVLKDKLAVFKPASPGAVSAAELKAMSRRGVSSVVVLDQNRPPDLDALAEAGLVGVWFPMDPTCLPQIPDCQLLCQECDRLLKSGQKVAVVVTPDSLDAERTVAAQLVHMGLPAGLAAKIMREAFRDKPLGLNDEQLLWDLELSNDLVDDISKPQRRGRRDRQAQPAIAKGSIASFGRPRARGTATPAL